MVAEAKKIAAGILFAASFLILLGCSGLPPRKEIPVNISSGVRAQIERLYSGNALERARGAYSLGNMGVKATPSVPFLTGLLSDSGAVFELTRSSNETSGASAYSTKVEKKTYIWEIARDALEKITGEHFGVDAGKWRKWWKDNREKYQ